MLGNFNEVSESAKMENELSRIEGAEDFNDMFSDDFDMGENRTVDKFESGATKVDVSDFFEDDGVSENPESHVYENESENWDQVFDDMFSDDFAGIKHDDMVGEKNSSSLDVSLENSESSTLRKEVIDGKMHYYDDNGNLYRVDNDLLPNNEYEINGYKYETDDRGRIISAEGTLHLKNHDGKLSIKDSIEDIGKGDQKEGDDRGHLIGDQFDGSNGLENMIPQDANINRVDFKNFENELAREVKEGKEVSVTIMPIYEGDSRRPKEIVVFYSIDGEADIKHFPNSKEVNNE